MLKKVLGFLLVLLPFIALIIGATIFIEKADFSKESALVLICVFGFLFFRDLSVQIGQLIVKKFGLDKDKE